MRNYLSSSVAAYSVMRDHVSKISWEAGQYLSACHAMSEFRYDMLINWMAESQIKFGYAATEAAFPEFLGPALGDEAEAIEENLKGFKICELRLAKYGDDLIVPSKTPDPDFAGKIAYIKSSAANACRLLDRAWTYLCGVPGVLICTSCLSQVAEDTDLSEGCPVCGASQGAFAHWALK